MAARSATPGVVDNRQQGGQRTSRNGRRFGAVCRDLARRARAVLEPERTIVLWLFHRRSDRKGSRRAHRRRRAESRKYGGARRRRCTRLDCLRNRAPPEGRLEASRRGVHATRRRSGRAAVHRVHREELGLLPVNAVTLSRSAVRAARSPRPACDWLLAACGRRSRGALRPCGWRCRADRRSRKQTCRLRPRRALRVRAA